MFLSVGFAAIIVI